MDYQIYDWNKAFSAWQKMPDITLVGVLPDAVAEQVKLPTAERRVFIHRDIVMHIHEQRGPGSVRAKLALKGVSEAPASPEYTGCNVEPSGRTSIICIKTVDEDPEPVVVVIKFIPAIRAGTKRDELWVSTAYTMINLRTLRSMLKQGKIYIVASS